MKLSDNKKLNAILINIYEGLQELGIEDVKRYYNEFNNELDYNIVQYGNLLIYYDDIRELYKNNNYKYAETMTNEQIWQTYKMHVRKVVKIIMENEV